VSGYLTVAEQCGALVDAGVLDRTTAVVEVFTASAGQLNLAEAADLVDNWQTARADRADMLMNVEQLLATCEHSLSTGTPVDPESLRPLIRDAARRSARRLLNRRRRLT
jgi:hypothetical protein